MQKGGLEEKIFDAKDWIPGYGAIHLFKRQGKMHWALRESWNNSLYVWLHGMYYGVLGCGLYQLYKLLK